MPSLTLATRLRYAVEVLRRHEYLFVMSHMRSYSSLLSHILNSNGEVSGYVETHQAYTNELDLLDLRLRVQHSLDGDRKLGRYVVDKLLHNHASVADRLVARNDVKMLFVVREPVRTIESTVAMAMRKKKVREGEKDDWKADPVRVSGYYVRRLDKLVEVAGKKPMGSAFFEADRLVDDTDTILAGLTKFLGLKSPLTSTYQTHELTGTAKFGDPTKFIKAGEIVRERDDYDVDIPPEVVEETTAAYKEAVERLSSLVATPL